MCFIKLAIAFDELVRLDEGHASAGYNETSIRH